jgi:hypothetical protein
MDMDNAPTARTYVCTNRRRLLHVELFESGVVSVCFDWGNRNWIRWYWLDEQCKALATGFVQEKYDPQPLLDWLLEHEDRTGFWSLLKWNTMNESQRSGLMEQIEKTITDL